MKIKVAPSLLAADSSSFIDAVISVKKYGIDFLHIDIMDGHFVPNISIGPAVVRDLRRKIKDLKFEAHLMISEPLKYTDMFIEAGSDIITLHRETISSSEFRKESARLHKKNIKIAIAINPDTGVSEIKDILSACDMVLVMTVVPGFGGQSFMHRVIPKISELRAIYKKDIAVDGGIDDKTGKLCVDAGANVLASGTYIFKANNKKSAIERLRKCQTV